MSLEICVVFGYIISGLALLCCLFFCGIYLEEIGLEQKSRYLGKIILITFLVFLFSICISWVGQRDVSLYKGSPYQYTEKDFDGEIRLFLMDNRGNAIILKRQSVHTKLDFKKEPGLYRENLKWIEYQNPKSILVKTVFLNGNSASIYLFSEQIPKIKMLNNIPRVIKKKFLPDSWMILKGVYPKTSWLCWEWDGDLFPKWGHLVKWSY